MHISYSFLIPTEILEAEKYSTAADVFSFAVLAYQVMTELGPYDDPEFSTAWKISEFVISGKVK